MPITFTGSSHIHTCARTDRQTDRQTDRYMHTDKCACMNTQRQMQTHTHTRPHARTHARTHMIQLGRKVPGSLAQIPVVKTSTQHRVEGILAYTVLLKLPYGEKDFHFSQYRSTVLQSVKYMTSCTVRWIDLFFFLIVEVMESRDCMLAMSAVPM